MDYCTDRPSAKSQLIRAGCSQSKSIVAVSGSLNIVCPAHLKFSKPAGMHGVDRIAAR
jgi:hypothetical protein